MAKSKRIKDEYIFMALGVVIVVIAVFGLNDYSLKQVQQENEIDTFDEQLPVQCEKGEWIEFPDMAKAADYEKLISSKRIIYDGAKDSFAGEDGRLVLSVAEDHSLSFFADRDIQWEGYKLKENAAYVKRIKCVGVEADKDVLQLRRKLMDYVSAHINGLAPEKTPGNDWQVETFYFVNNTDLYVQYETPGSFMEEAPYDSHLWLVRVADFDADEPVLETLAYIQEDAEDSEKNIVKQGQDLYADTKNMTIYEFDDEAGQWVLQ